MSVKKYVVTLSQDEREQVERVARSYKASSRERLHARILLRADSAVGDKDTEIAAALHTCSMTVSRVRQHCFEEGWRAAVYRRPQTRRKARVLDGSAEAHLIALACSAPPEGHQRWSLVLLKERLIELEVVDTVSHETIRQTLKKTHSSHG
jgi:putative transposase